MKFLALASLTVLLLAGCGTPGAVMAPATAEKASASSVRPSLGAAETAKATSIVTRELAPAGSAFIKLEGLKLHATALPGIVGYSVTKRETTRWMEVRISTITGVVNLNSGAMSQNETLVKSEVVR